MVSSRPAAARFVLGRGNVVVPVWEWAVAVAVVVNYLLSMLH
jgi:hypothetical protein